MEVCRFEFMVNKKNRLQPFDYGSMNFYHFSHISLFKEENMFGVFEFGYKGVCVCISSDPNGERKKQKFIITY